LQIVPNPAALWPENCMRSVKFHPLSQSENHQVRLERRIVMFPDVWRKFDV
jgi:hypothetical protein